MWYTFYVQTGFTRDKEIRLELKRFLKKEFKNTPHTLIVEELGLRHGQVRVDIAVINGVMHGYEIKSDKDTLDRLPEQMKEYNAVFDKLTLVVGRHHLYNAVNIIPDWWGIVLAKIDINDKLVFHTIRQAEHNQKQIGISIARLLWRQEALQILEEQNKASGVRSKPREFIYERLVNELDTDTLKQRVRDALLFSRKDWRVDSLLISSGD